MIEIDPPIPREEEPAPRVRNKSLEDRFQELSDFTVRSHKDLHTLVAQGITVAEVAAKNAARAEAAALDLSRTTLDHNGHPGAIVALGNSMLTLRAMISPSGRSRSMVLSAVIAAVVAFAVVAFAR